MSPSRDNYGYQCTLVEDDADLPDHVTPCTCDTHNGVCEECGFKITVGPSGTEYGHARATNRRADEDGVRRDCPHRPTTCNTGETHIWEGYDEDDGRKLATDGGRSETEAGREGSE